jgi:hypothetical protein
MNVLQKHARHPHPLKRQMVELLSGYCEGEARAGRMRSLDGEVFARTFLGGIIQYVMSEHVEGPADPLTGIRLTVPVFLRGLIDLLLRGALADKPRRRR